MGMLIRNYIPEDSSSIVAVFRDSQNSLRQSRGGIHSDSYVDSIIDLPDSEILDRLTYGTIILVAQDTETKEIVGMGSIATRWKHKLLMSAYSANFFVRENYQRGRTGINIGSLLREAIIGKAIALGYRKMYGYSTPGAIGFHEKFGAKFYPSMNANKDGIEYHYYEIELRKSILNGIRIEPLLSELSPASRILESLKKTMDAKSRKPYQIGNAGKDDYPRILEILKTANMHNIPSEEMPSLDFRKCFVAKVDGKIVGVGGYKILDDGCGKTTVLVVDPAYRKQGIGKALQEKRMETMVRFGAKKIITNADLPESIAWYKKNFGYKEIGKVKKTHEFGNSNIRYWTTLELVVNGDRQ